MTEGNFVDYVKVHVASGNGGKGSAHLHEKNTLKKVVQMEVTVAEVAMLLLEVIPICGHCII